MKPKCLICFKELTDYRSKYCFIHKPVHPNSLKNLSDRLEKLHKIPKPTCIDCGEIISNKDHNRCWDCHVIFNRGKNHPRFGTTHTKETLTIISKKLKGRQYTEEYKKKMAISCKGINKGIKNGMFGKLSFPWTQYNQFIMRSSYEANFAKWCDLSGIKWSYESKTFDLGNTTYTPDFYLPEFDCYIEIKGWWRPEAKKKFNKFKRLYKNINIEVFDKPRLTQFGILNLKTKIERR